MLPFQLLLFQKNFTKKLTIILNERIKQISIICGEINSENSNNGNRFALHYENYLRRNFILPT